MFKFIKLNDWISQCAWLTNCYNIVHLVFLSSHFFLNVIVRIVGQCLLWNIVHYESLTWFSLQLCLSRKDTSIRKIMTFIYKVTIIKYEIVFRFNINPLVKGVDYAFFEGLHFFYRVVFLKWQNYKGNHVKPPERTIYLIASVVQQFFH